MQNLTARRNAREIHAIAEGFHASGATDVRYFVVEPAIKTALHRGPSPVFVQI